MAVAPLEFQIPIVVDESASPPGDRPPDPPLNLAALRYMLGLIDSESGEMLRIPVADLAHEQDTGEVAQRVVAAVPDLMSDRGPLWELCRMGTPAYLLAGGATLSEVMRGTILEVGERQSGSGSFPVVIYDPLFTGLRDKQDMLFLSGQTITDVLNAYAARSEFELGEIHDPGTQLPAMVLRQKSVVDGINEVLKILQDRGGGRLVLRTKQGKLECIRPGTNNTVYWLRQAETAIQSGVKGSITKLITKVLVLGHGNDDEALPVRETRTGLTEFVGAQEIVYAEETDSDHMVGLMADQVLAEKGFPEWEYTHTSWLVPWLQKWDRVRITDAVIDGYFLVTGISSSYNQRTMRLNLISQEAYDRQTANIELTVALERLKAEAQAAAAAESDTDKTGAHGVVVKHALPGTAWTSGGTHGGHPAVDIFAAKEEPILAPVAGTMRPMSAPLGGNCGVLAGEDGRHYYFAHCARPMVSGAVKRGQTIGNVGNTGNAIGTAPHVHFAIATNGGVFGALNGSGDITGDATYWTAQAKK